MDPRGRGRGRAGPARGGRGAGAPRGGAGGAPQGANAPFSLAAQLRQTSKATEPEEMKVLRKFQGLGAAFVQSVYGRSGRTQMLVGFPASSLPIGTDLLPAENQPVTYFDLQLVEVALINWEQAERIRRGADRISVRLGPDRQVPWGQLTQEERRICLLSNKEYAKYSFRAPPGQDPGEDAEAT